MFSDRFYVLCFVTGEVLNLFNVTNMRFNKTLKKFGHATGRGIKTRIQVTYSMMMLWAVASAYAAYTFRKQGDFDRFNLTMAYWLIGGLASIALSLLHLRCHDMVLVMNGLLQFMELVNRKYMPNHDPNKSLYNLVCDVLLCLLACVCSGSGIIMWLLLIYDPRGMIFLGSLVPRESFTLLIRFLIIAYHTYLIIVAHIGVAVFCAGILLYGYYITPFYLRELKLGRAKYYTDNSMRTIDNIQLVFRSIQVLHTNGLYVVGILVVIANGYIMFTVMFCNAVLMQYWSDLMAMSRVQLSSLSITILAFWTFVLEMGRFFFANGNKTLRSWKGGKWGSQSNNKLMKKFLRSCKPILICYGTQFVIRRATVLNFLRGIVRGTFRILLLLGKKKKS